MMHCVSKKGHSSFHFTSYSFTLKLSPCTIHTHPVAESVNNLLFLVQLGCVCNLFFTASTSLYIYERVYTPAHVFALGALDGESGEDEVVVNLINVLQECVNSFLR
jgi:hypothetical protein